MVVSIGKPGSSLLLLVTDEESDSALSLRFSKQFLIEGIVFILSITVGSMATENWLRSVSDEEGVASFFLHSKYKLMMHYLQAIRNAIHSTTWNYTMCPFYYYLYLNHTLISLLYLDPAHFTYSIYVNNTHHYTNFS